MPLNRESCAQNLKKYLSRLFSVGYLVVSYAHLEYFTSSPSVPMVNSRYASSGAGSPEGSGSCLLSESVLSDSRMSMRMPRLVARPAGTRSRQRPAA